MGGAIRNASITGIMEFRSYDAVCHELRLEGASYDPPIRKLMAHSIIFDYWTFKKDKRYRVTIEELQEGE